MVVGSWKMGMDRVGLKVKGTRREAEQKKQCGDKMRNPRDLSCSDVNTQNNRMYFESGTFQATICKAKGVATVFVVTGQ